MKLETRPVIVAATIEPAESRTVLLRGARGVLKHVKSEQTVKNHLRRIFAKLGVANRVALAVHALEHQRAATYDTGRVAHD